MPIKINNIQITWEDPAGLLANPRNHRTHPKAQATVLRSAFEREGWIDPVIVNTTTGHIIDGHLRVALASEEGLDKIPVIRVACSEQEERIILARHDRIGDLAEIDLTALKENVLELEGDGVALDEMGWADINIEEEPPARVPIGVDPGAADKSGCGAPLKWFGGKGSMTAKLLPFFPEHKIYVEVFGGGASMLFSKTPQGVEVYNDLNSGLVNFFRALRDEGRFEKLYKAAVLSIVSREEYYFARDNWEKEQDLDQKAYLFFIAARQSFSGIMGSSWSHGTMSEARGMASAVSSWLSCIDKLPEFHQRMVRVQVENIDFREVMAKYDSPESFFYLDPPYVMDTRKSGGYKHELSDQDQKDFVKACLSLKGKALVSGYPSEMYKPLIDAGWGYQEWKVKSCVTSGKNKDSNRQRIESVWFNYPVHYKMEDYDENEEPEASGV